jgi:hypothetical protein
MNFPVGCDTPAQRTEFLYCAQEKLQRLHNFMRLWYKEGITQQQWMKLPKRVQNKYSYKPQLTETEFRDFQNNVFEPINDRVVGSIGQLREQLKQSTQWEIDIEEL